MGAEEPPRWGECSRGEAARAEVGGDARAPARVRKMRAAAKARDGRLKRG